MTNSTKEFINYESKNFKKNVLVPVEQHTLFSVIIPKPTKDLLQLLYGISKIKIPLIPENERATYLFKQEGWVKDALSNFFKSKRQDVFKWGFGHSHCWIKRVGDETLTDNYAIIYTEQQSEWHHTKNIY